MHIDATGQAGSQVARTKWSTRSEYDLPTRGAGIFNCPGERTTSIEVEGSGRWEVFGRGGGGWVRGACGRVGTGKGEGGAQNSGGAQKLGKGRASVGDSNNTRGTFDGDGPGVSQVPAP